MHFKRLSIALLLGTAAVFCFPEKVENNPAKKCNETICKLPDCLCSSTEVPKNMSPGQIPQIVMLTFDDALTALLYNEYYSQLFHFKNPNGCKIGITFFLSHDYTDYSMVNAVWQLGHEIASHSISHQTPTTHWLDLDYGGWVDEMYGLKQIATTFGNISGEHIVGARAPFLQTGGDTMFQALYDKKFQYDCSEPTFHYTDPPLWPYTLDYKSEQDCQIEPCPSDSFPNFWEIPLVDYNDTSNIPCAMLDTCPGARNRKDTYDFLLYNFQKHYGSNKAPFGVFTHASWFLTNTDHYLGYVDFLEHINKLSDVYIVTISKAIQWIRNPTALSNISHFEPWLCISNRNSFCSGITCHYNESAPGGERYMKVCTPECPPSYPWVGNPYGNGTSSH